MAEKKWYETKVGKIATSPFMGPLGPIAKAVSKGIEKDVAKGKALRSQQENIVQDISKMQLAPETMTAYGQAMQLSQQGLDPYTRQQMMERLGMGAQTTLGLYRAGKLGLAKVTDVDRAMRQGIMQYGAAEAQARRQNLGTAIQAGMNVGAQRLGLEKYRAEGLYNYVTGRRAERRQTLTNLLSGGARLGALALSGSGAPKTQ